MYISLDDDVEILDITFLNLLEEIIERYLLRFNEFAAVLFDPLLRNGARQFLIQGGQLISRLGHVRKPQYFHRHGRRSFADGLAPIIDHGTHFTKSRSGHDGITDAQRTALHQYRGHRTAALIKLRLDDDAPSLSVRIGLEFLHLSH